MGLETLKQMFLGSGFKGYGIRPRTQIETIDNLPFFLTMADISLRNPLL